MPVTHLRAVPGRTECDRVLARIAPLVLGWCRRLGAPDAEEAAQEVLVAVARRIPALERLDTLEPWVFAVTRNTVRRHRQRTWWRRWIGSPSLDRVDPRPALEGVVDSGRLARDVERVLDRLPARQREVLVLSTVEGRTDAEVARLLDVPGGTVKSRLRLARARFRVEVSRDPRLRHWLTEDGHGD